MPRHDKNSTRSNLSEIQPAALLGSASYPVPVRRPATSLPVSFTPASRNDALRVASLTMTSSREDSHLQVDPCWAHMNEAAN